MGMTVAAAEEKLRGLGIRLDPLRPGRFADLDREHRERIAKLKSEHADREGTIKAKADERIARQQHHQALLLEESRLSKTLRRDEAILERQEDDRVTLTHRQNRRQFVSDLGGTLSERDQQELADEVAAGVDDTANPNVQRIVKWLEQVWRDEAIDVRFAADPRLNNGSASRSGRYVFVSALTNLRSCVTAGHETGHLLHEELADNREILAEDKYHRISVPREIAAWEWLLNHIPYWDSSMHCDMSRAIGSYRRAYATDDEKVAIDRLCSDLSFRRTQLRCALEG
jgi:hypothetical protein